MTTKLAQIGNVQERVDGLQREKEELGKALVDSSQINKQLKELLTEKDGIIAKMQAELEKFLSIKNELGPVFKESVEMKATLAAKDEEIATLKASLTEATKIVEQLPNIEAYVKQAAGAIKEMGEENRGLKEQVGSNDLAKRRHS
jgi:predicted RNase H-like nuclease (RuvC/YqgF family)